MIKQSHFVTPRTVEEAFGPYARFETEKEPFFIRAVNFLWSIFR
jgi:hypothetical protein